MSRETQAYKKSFSTSIGSGLGSVFGGSGKQYYILEHKISSRYHKVGESQEIIVDNVELGRDAKCQVRFDESFSSVSRRHAAIVREGDKWKLVNLSATNPTILNGNKVLKEWYLQNGDEIQLSVGGPRLGFIVPSGKQATVGSIGFTRRLSLFRQQALRPYKTAITMLSIVLVLAIGGLATWMIMKDNEHERIITDMKKEKAVQDSIIGIRFAEQNAQLVDAEAKAEAIKRESDQKIAELRRRIDNSGGGGSVTVADDQALIACEPYVYHIRVTTLEVSLPDGESGEVDYGWIGTGFLLNDGRFVTARHVAEPWFYIVDGGEIDEGLLFLNKVVHNGGKVVAHFTAYSSSGDTFSFTNSQFICNRQRDESVTDEDGLLVKVANADCADWAYIRTSGTQGLRYDRSKSESLERGVKLAVLGFPFGIGANSPTDIRPQLSSGETTASGLTNGVIITANTSYEQGNSGGPVFYKDGSGNLSVVGIVSAGAGRSTGFIVPINAIY